MLQAPSVEPKTHTMCSSPKERFSKWGIAWFFCQNLVSYCGNLEKWYISRLKLENSHPQCSSPKDIQYLRILPLENSSWSTLWKRDDPLKVRNQFPKWCFPRHVDLPTARCLFLQLGAVQRYYNLKSKQKAGRRTEKWSSTVHARSKNYFSWLSRI